MTFLLKSCQVLQLLTDEQSSDGPDSFSVLSSQSLGLQDAIFDSDYSSTHYQDDLRRHREIALEFWVKLYITNFVTLATDPLKGIW